jgi:hypothetical protein
MKGFRLGVSQDILPYTRQEVLDADYRFNKFLLGTFEFAVKGLAVGAVASLFFLHRRRVIFYGAGFGAGLAFFHEFNPR